VNNWSHGLEGGLGTVSVKLLVHSVQQSPRVSAEQVPHKERVVWTKLYSRPGVTCSSPTQDMELYVSIL
jgi:hypothetical protein